jgi:TetR/AcrR family transcriptional repressor of nem operon
LARTREFAERDVVDAAMRLFWSRGYERATLDDLLRRLRISKSSLYGVFSNKRELLSKALSHYGKTWMLGLIEPLSRPDAARKEIEQAFASLVTRFAGPLARQGCLMTNCAVDVAPHDAIVRENTRLLREGFEQAFRSAVERGQRQGTIQRRESAASLARVLVNALNGMSVLAKLKPGRAVLEDIARMNLSLLD